MKKYLDEVGGNRKSYSSGACARDTYQVYCLLYHQKNIIVNGFVLSSFSVGGSTKLLGKPQVSAAL